MDDLEITSGFTVDINADQDTVPGGSVTFDVPPAAPIIITVLREVEQTQETNYTSFDAFPAESHETALDKLTMLVQQLSNDGINAVRIPVTDPPGINTILPNAEERAEHFLFFD